ncbi:uncharacterized protein EDB91DRAFT_1077803 [Suillus paluster]|uniref:uncharacterized protein n=1 Tax=Suillus paluster TaxID=48578 RepID=UPI001B86CF0E|nr:uncharacterized protein EDB91DRAFT_1077803 [Suillus paluster]KAG1752391.1 hypothetical protein EDB91DRAFT_1077803 [Suillus paluster]
MFTHLGARAHIQASHYTLASLTSSDLGNETVLGPWECLTRSRLTGPYTLRDLAAVALTCRTLSGSTLDVLAMEYPTRDSDYEPDEDRSIQSYDEPSLRRNILVFPKGMGNIRDISFVPLSRSSLTSFEVYPEFNMKVESWPLLSNLLDDLPQLRTMRLGEHLDLGIYGHVAEGPGLVGLQMFPRLQKLKLSSDTNFAVGFLTALQSMVVRRSRLGTSLSTSTVIDSFRPCEELATTTIDAGPLATFARPSPNLLRLQLGIPWDTAELPVLDDETLTILSSRPTCSACTQIVVNVDSPWDNPEVVAKFSPRCFLAEQSRSYLLHLSAGSCHPNIPQIGGMELWNNWNCSGGHS